MPQVDIIQLLKQDGGEKFYPVTHVDAVIGLKDASFFEKVDDGEGHISIKLKSEYTGLWADGWIAAGGIGSGSGGGGGLIQTVYTWSDMQEMSNAPEDNTASAFNAKTVYEIYKMLQAGGLDGGGYLKESGGGFFLTSSSEKILLKGSGHSLSGLDDVSVYNPAINDLLAWSGYSWVNIPQSAVRPDMSGYVTTDALSAAVSNLQTQIDALENFFEIDSSGNVTLKSTYQNLWVPGWLAGGGIGNESGGGSYSPGTGIDITNNVISLQTASTSALGGVKVDGTTITISNGVITAVGGGGGSTVSVQSLAVTTASESRIASITVDGVTTTLYNDVAWGTYNSETKTVGLKINGTLRSVCVDGYGGGISSIGLTMPSCFSVSPSTLTSNGTFAVSFASQTKNYVLAAPSSANGTPSFRALVAADIPDLSGKYVTLDTDQNNISGAKTFTKHLTVNASVGESYIDIGNARLVYDSGTNALHITKKSGTQAVGLFADGFVAAGGVSGQTTSSFVDLESNQEIGGNKTFNGNVSVEGSAYFDVGFTMSGDINIDGVVISTDTVDGATGLTVSKNAKFTWKEGSVTKSVSIKNLLDRIVALGG